eukprot:273917-Chlamydomonas_euryale.AAC.4
MHAKPAHARHGVPGSDERGANAWSNPPRQRSNPTPADPRHACGAERAPRAHTSARSTRAATAPRHPHLAPAEQPASSVAAGRRRRHRPHPLPASPSAAGAKFEAAVVTGVPRLLRCPAPPARSESRTRALPSRRCRGPGAPAAAAEPAEKRAAATGRPVVRARVRPRRRPAARAAERRAVGCASHSYPPRHLEASAAETHREGGGALKAAAGAPA